MSESFHCVVIGAGCDGMAAATTLASRGRVLVLERAEEVGGVCRGLKLAAGFRSCGLLHDAGRLRPWVVRRLALERHGIRRIQDEVVVFAAPGGERLHYSPRSAATDADLDRRRPGGARRHRAFREALDRYRGVLADFCDRAPLDLVHPETVGALSALRRLAALRRLGGSRMLELLRWVPMSVKDLLEERLDDPLLQAGLSLPALAGGFAGARSPGTALDFLLHDATYAGDVEGGGPAIAAALAAACREAGVEIRTGHEVREIVVDDDGRAAGVVLAGGAHIAADHVVAGGSPRRVFVDLLPAGAVGLRTAQRAGEIRMRGTTAFLLLCLKSKPRLSPTGAATRAVIAADPTAVERAFDGAKYGQLPETPVLDLRIAAAEGGGVISIAVHFVPYRAAADDRGESLLADRVTDLVEAALPGLTRSLVERRLLLPRDLEAEYALDGGQLHRGEHALDQRLVRPFPECHGYATPIPGLYLTGAGTHPGGGTTCVAGVLAAERIRHASRVS